jgi:hypothetical protein
MERLSRISFFAVFMLSASSSMPGAVITFAPLLGPNNAAYLGHTEAGFTVMPVSGSWFQGLGYGNPVPSIYDGPVFSPGIGSLQITGGASPFTFSSVDYSSNGGQSTYIIQGFLGASIVFSDIGNLVPSLGPGFGFTTLTSGHPSAQISRLVIQVTPTQDVTSINLDNINLSTVAVPEPATLLLVVTGLTAFLVKRTKVKKS